MADPSVTLGAVNMQAGDPAALASFWASVTGSAPTGDGSSFYLPPVGPTGFAMFFRPSGGSRPAQQVTHLDLTVAWGTRRAQVERLLELGATHRWDVLEEVPHVRWSTLTDPEGNFLCVAEHPPR